MLLQAKTKLEEKIVQLLMRQPNMSAAEILGEVNQSRADYSIQAVYKELRKLHAVGVVSKSKQRYSLRVPWVMDVAALTDRMRTLYLNPKVFDSLLPAKNHKKIWHFTNITALNNFWSQVLLIVLNRAKDKKLYGYSPHPWYHLLETEQEDQYIKSLGHAQSKLYLMVGGRTFLDKWAARFWPSTIVEYSFSPGPFEKNRSWHFDLIDDYLISVYFDHKTVLEVENLYRNTPNWESLDLADVMRLLKTPIKAKFVLEHNLRKAESIRSKFKRFFGL